MITDAIGEVANVLHGKGASVTLAAPLYKYVTGLPGQVKYPLARAGAEWRFTGQSDARLRKLGAFWVVVELPHDGPEGIFVSIYTDKLTAAAK